MGPFGTLTSKVHSPHPGTRAWKPFKLLMAANVKLFQLTGGRVGGRMDAAEVCVLHHRGAKSGKPRQTPLLCVRDGDAVGLVGSFAGSPSHPAWIHNLRAHPDAEVELRGERRRVSAREVTAGERDALRDRFLEVWPVLEVYESRTSRTIPFVRLEPRSS